TLRAPSAHLHLLRGPAYVVKLLQNPIFKTSVGKKDPQIRPFFGFSGARWVKAWVKINLDSRAFGGHWARSKYAVFWQTGQLKGVFSTRTETKQFTGFPRRGQDPKSEKKAQFGRIFSYSWNPYLQGYPQGGEVLFHFVKDFFAPLIFRSETLLNGVFGDFILHKNFSIRVEVNVMEDLGIPEIIKIRNPVL